MGTTIAEKKKTLYKRLSQIQKCKPTVVPTINKVVSLTIDWVLKKHESDSKFQRKIISPDETTLHLGG